MEKGKVRFAGPLARVEDKSTRDYWCVIRDGNFLAYAFEDGRSETDLFNLQQTPVQTFAISHLSAKAVVLSGSAKRTPTNFALELECAKTDQCTTFYSKHEWALERWVDAIKTESSPDNVFPVDSPHGSPLPPSIDVALSSDATSQLQPLSCVHRASPAFSHSEGKTYADGSKKFDVYVEQGDSVMDSIVGRASPSLVKISRSPKLTRSPLLTNKKLKQKFMERASLDPVSYTRHHRYMENAMSPLSSPALSSWRSSAKGTYQDSADESSAASSLTSSPAVPAKFGAHSSHASCDVGERTGKTTREVAPGAAARKVRRAKNAQIWKKKQIGNMDLANSASGPDAKLRSTANQFFYTGTNGPNSSGSSMVANQVNAQRTKHTISALPEYGFKTLSHKQRRNNSVATGPKEMVKRTSHRHSIAPLASLDQQINQRKRNSKPRSNSVTPLAHSKLPGVGESESSSSVSTESESELDDSFSKSFSRSASATSSDNFTVGEQSDSLSESNASLGEDFKLALQILKSETASPSNSSPAGARQSKSTLQAEELRKKSGGFGSQFLRRAKSVVGKRKAIDAPDPSVGSPLMRQLSLTATKPKGDSKITSNPGEHAIESAPTRATSAPSSPEEAKARSVSMEGWLYRRKRMKWLRLWAILSSDKQLSFYKNEPDPNSRSSAATIVYDLRSGCEVANMAQDKGANTFELIVTQVSNEHVIDAMQRNEPQTTLTARRDPANTSSQRTKRMQLMCKSVQDFVHWMKAFVMIDTSQTATSGSRTPRTAVRTLLPIKQRERVSTENPKEAKQHVVVAARQITPASPRIHRIASFGCDERVRQQEVESRDFGTKATDSFEGADRAGMTGIRPRRVPSSDYLHDVGRSAVHAEHLDNRLPMSQSSSARGEKIEGLEQRLVSADENNATSHGSTSEPRASSSESETSYTTFSYSNDLLFIDDDTALGVTSAPLSTEQAATDVNACNSIKQSPDVIAERGSGKPAVDIRECKQDVQTFKHELTSGSIKTEQSRTDANFLKVNNGGYQTMPTDYVTETRHENESTESKMHNPTSCCDVLEDVDAAANKVCRRSSDTDIKELTSCAGADQNLRQAVTAACRDMNKAEEMGNFGANGKFRRGSLSSRDGALRDSPLVARREERDDRCVARASSFGGQSSVTQGSHSRQRSFSPVRGIQNKTGAETPTAVVLGSSDASSADGEGNITGTSCLVSNCEEVNRNVSFLRRSHSDGNLLEACCDQPYRMRTLKKSVPELTKIDFIEIYGLTPKKTSKAAVDRKALTCIATSGTGEYFMPCRDLQVAGIASRPLSDGFSSAASTTTTSDSAGSGNENSKLSSKSASSGNIAVDEIRTRKLGNIARSAFRKSFKTREDASARKAKPTVCQVPASQLVNSSHRSYLDRRNKKKQWERYFCVLQDSCLYFYNSPHSEMTQDALLLRGYDVVADVTNMNRSRFTFRLEQRESQTLYFSTENHEDFLLWVGSMEKDTRSVVTTDSGRNSTVSQDVSPAHSDKSCSSEKHSDSGDEASAYRRSLINSPSHAKFEQELVEMQKHKLLREIAVQQQQILDEEKELNKKVLGERLNPSLDAYRMTSHAPRRVIEKYDRFRETEELKTMRSMAHLNRRRNSAQLKVDQLAREIAPRSGKKRRQDHQRFAAIESKLNEMKSQLAEIDREILEQQAKKQNTLEKLLERQELELLVTEQRESLAIMRRHEHDISAVRKGKCRTRSGETLASIDELSSLSDGNSSDSIHSHQTHRSLPRTESSARVSATASVESLDSDVFAKLRDYSDDNGVAPPWSNPSLGSIDDTTTTSSLASSVSSLAMVKDLPDTKEKKIAQVSPALLAEIEQFEEFSKMTLQKQRSKSPSHH